MNDNKVKTLISKRDLNAPATLRITFACFYLIIEHIQNLLLHKELTSNVTNTIQNHTVSMKRSMFLPCSKLSYFPSSVYVYANEALSFLQRSFCRNAADKKLIESHHGISLWQISDGN